MNKSYYQTTHQNSDFTYEHLSYADYIQTMRDIIANTRLDLTEQTIESILTANSPAEYLPAQLPAENGILLVHGMRDSPNAMSSFFNYYRAKGFLVRSLLLPGHGTVPGDLLNVELSAWIKAFNYAVASCRKQVKNLFIAGFSTGASLALYQSYFGLDAQGVILLAPAIRIKNSLAAISQWHPYFSFMGEKSRWFIQIEENDYAKYQSIPFNGVAQVYRLTKKMAFYLQQQINIPLFMVLSDDDESIDTSAAEQFFTHQKNPLNRLLIYTTRQKSVADSRIEQLSSCFSEQRILDFSHISLPISPDHPHYGKEGDFQDIIHYQFWWGKIFNHKRQLPLHYGSFNWHNLANYHLARLTYNPDFYPMMERIDQFIQSSTRRPAA